MTEDLQQLLEQVEADTRSVLTDDHETMNVGPFMAAFHRDSDLVWYNYAVPNAPTANDLACVSDAVGRLRQLFGERNRTLRFEFFEALWPLLGPALETCGLKLQGKRPLMLCAPSDLQRVTASGFSVNSLDEGADEETLTEFVIAAKVGFAMDSPEVQPKEIVEQRRHLRSGRLRCAFARMNRRMVGVGTLVVGNEELVGVGTLPEFRRRGVAASVSSHLIAEHFAHGGKVVWLTTGDAAAEAVYRKIGFRPAGVRLHYTDAG